MPRRFERRVIVGGLVFALCAAGLGLDAAQAAEPKTAEPETELKATAGKADRLPVSPPVESETIYPNSAGVKEDRQPLPPQTTKQKSLAKSNDRLSPLSGESQSMNTPTPDRLTPE